MQQIMKMSVNLENDALKTNPKIVIDGKEYLPRYDKMCRWIL